MCYIKGERNFSVLQVIGRNRTYLMLNDIYRIKSWLCVTMHTLTHVFDVWRTLDESVSSVLPSITRTTVIFDAIMTTTTTLNRWLLASLSPCCLSIFTLQYDIICHRNLYRIR
jgi:hypothetical protein